MTDTLTAIEAEITAAGHALERKYVFGELDTQDGDGSVIRVDGQLVATGASVGQAEAGLRGWWKQTKAEAT